MRQAFWKSNGRPARAQALAPGAGLLGSPRVKPARRYLFAIFAVLFAWGCVLLGGALFSAPPLLFFALALMLTAIISGIRPGLIALALAILLSDFFFVHPTFELSLNRTVLRLSLYYLAGMLLSYYVAKHSQASHKGFSMSAF